MSLSFLLTVILLSFGDVTLGTPTGCSCYNPLVGTSQEQFGEPGHACSSNSWCFVLCDGPCSDKTVISGGIFKGKCRSTRACSGGSCSGGGCNCGLTLQGGQLQFIIGGTDAGKNEYPWQVGFVNKENSDVWCGGTLISDAWVITAAHCTQEKHNHQAENIQVLLGVHDTSQLSLTKTVRSDVALVVNHPDYQKGTNTNYDFSLVKLSTKIDFNEFCNIRPICLPKDSSNDYSGFAAVVSGWGRVVEGGEVSSVLQEVEVKVISDKSCKTEYKYEESEITDQMMCATTDEGGKDACQGDSGGPLVSSGSGDGFTPGQNYELVGVVSWGRGCADPDYPGVYARVSKQLGWIAKTTSEGWNTCPRL